MHTCVCYCVRRPDVFCFVSVLAFNSRHLATRYRRLVFYRIGMYSAASVTDFDDDDDYPNYNSYSSSSNSSNNSYSSSSSSSDSSSSSHVFALKSQCPVRQFGEFEENYGWIQCQSKSYPDRMYYHNMHSGCNTWYRPISRYIDIPFVSIKRVS